MPNSCFSLENRLSKGACTTYKRDGNNSDETKIVSLSNSQQLCFVSMILSLRFVSKILLVARMTSVRVYQRLCGEHERIK